MYVIRFSLFSHPVNCFQERWSLAQFLVRRYRHPVFSSPANLREHSGIESFGRNDRSLLPVPAQYSSWEGPRARRIAASFALAYLEQVRSWEPEQSGFPQNFGRLCARAVASQTIWPARLRCPAPAPANGCANSAEPHEPVYLVASPRQAASAPPR